MVRGSTKEAVAVFSNFGNAYVLRINDVPASTGYGEPVQKLFNFRDGERVVGALSARPRADSAQGGAGGGGQQAAASACASAWIRTASCRRAPGAGSRKPPEGDEIVGVARVIKPDDVVCVVTSDARALVCKADELPELANPGRGVTVIKVGDETRGRLRRRPRQGQGRHHRRDRRRQGAADRPGAYKVTSRGGKGHAMQAQDAEIVRVSSSEPPATTPELLN